MTNATTGTAPSKGSSELEYVFTRVIDAPRELVFKAFTDPKHIVHWWGPRGFTSSGCEMDLRPGGVFRIVMHGPDGTDYPNRAVYREIVPNERIVYVNDWGDDRPSQEKLFIWTFTDQDGKTLITAHIAFKNVEDRNATLKLGMVEGFKGCMDRLSEELASEGGFTISRTFDAPRELVFKAWTERERLAQWFGPKGFTVESSTLELRPRGSYHYGLRSPTGQVMWGIWAFRDVAAPERIAFVASFSNERGEVIRAPFSNDWPLEVLSVVSFAEHDGKTMITMKATPINASDAERATFTNGYASMTQGWGGTFEQLGAYLATAQKGRAS